MPSRGVGTEGAVPWGSVGSLHGVEEGGLDLSGKGRVRLDEWKSFGTVIWEGRGEGWWCDEHAASSSLTEVE